MYEATSPRMLAAALVLAISMMLVSAMPAYAASLRVSAQAKPTASTVDFTAKVSRRSTVNVTVYKGPRKVRTLKARRCGSTYKARWNLKDAGGRRLNPGTYGYVVSATARNARRSVHGRVSVPATPALALTSAALDLARALASAGGRFVGFYVSGDLSDAVGLNAVQSDIGAHAGVVNVFVSDSEGFPTTKARLVRDNGSIPMITWEFSSLTGVGVDAIANGSMDAYIRRFADDARASGGEIWLRPFHEFNGNWYPWTGTVGPNTPAKVVAAWRHIHDIFAAEGAANVKFVWCANSESVPGTTANAIQNYWPGDAYVDYTAIDAYNWGTAETSSAWRSFATVVDPAYRRITALTAKPMIIAETGCAEQGGNKAQWISDMFASIKSAYTRIQGICWFNVQDTNEDWRVESSSAALSAFAGAAQAGY